MSDLSERPGPRDAAATVSALEERLRVLHALRAEAQLIEGFEPAYVQFVRSLRERLHPRGVREVREVRLADALTVAVDLGDRLGCDFYYGYVEESFEAQIFAASLRPNAVVVDVGANFGYYTLMAARAAPYGVVYAFEPDPLAFELLERNVAANGLRSRVVAVPWAVGGEDGEAELQLAEESAFTGIRATARSLLRGVLRVPLRMLDSYMAERDLRAIDALKIDVEGLEALVLRGALGTLGASPDPLILFEISAKNRLDADCRDLDDVLATLFAAGFHGLVADLASEHGLRELPSPDRVSELASANVFLVRRGAAEARLRQCAAARTVARSGALDAQVPDRQRSTAVVYTGIDPALAASTIRAKEATIERLRSECERLTAVAERVTAQNAALRSQVAELNERLASSAARQAEHTRDMLGAATRRIDELEERLRQQEEYKLQLEAKLGAARADRDSLRSELSRQHALKEQLKAELNRIVAERDQLRRERATLVCEAPHRLAHDQILSIEHDP